MANTGTPSMSISMGSELLEAFGDLKGAAKAVADEAKDAKRVVSDANKELKELERQQKKNVREAEKIKKGLDKLSPQERQNAEKQISDLMDSSKLKAKMVEVTDKQRVVDRKNAKKEDLKQAAKEKSEKKREDQKQKDMLDDVLSLDAKSIVVRMLKSKVGSGASGVANAMQKMGFNAATSAKIGGLASTAGPLYLAYKVGEKAFQTGTKLVDIQHEFRDRGKKVAESLGIRSTAMQQELIGLSGRQLSSDFLGAMSSEASERQGKAAADVAKKQYINYDFGAAVRDFEVPILKKRIFSGVFSGSSEMELAIERRASARQAEEQKLRGAASQFGTEFAENIRFDKLKDSTHLFNAWNNHVQEDGWRFIAAAVGGSLADVALGKQEWIETKAAKLQQSTIQAEATRRANEVTRANANPEWVAQRHIRTSRFQGLERQRRRMFMQVAPY